MTAIQPIDQPNVPPIEAEPDQPLDADSEGQSSSGPYGKSYMRIKIGSTTYSSLKGEIVGSPYIALRTNQMSEVKVNLNDPNLDIFNGLGGQDEVEVVIGMIGGPSQNIFMGNVFDIGRQPPHITSITAVDKTSQLQSNSPGANYRAEQPIDLEIVDETDNAVIQEIEDRLSGISSDTSVSDVDEAVSAIASLVENIEPEKVADVQSMLQAAMEELPNNSIAASQLLGVLETLVLDPEDDGSDSAAEPVLEAISEVLGEGKISAAAHASATSKLKFVNQSGKHSDDIGDIRLQETEIGHAVSSAKRVGDVVIARGNTIRQVAPGEGDPSGVVLDYGTNPGVFINWPKVVKRTGIMSEGFGATIVQNWLSDQKTMVGATVVTPGQIPQHPTGNIQVPQWGNVILNEPIFPGCIYTWADATKNGSRVPTAAIMERIIVIAQAIQPLTDQTVGQGNKWTITSWYRDPASNAAAKGRAGSRHLQGDAVDAWFPDMRSLHSQLQDSWQGGLAIASGFIHIDARPKGPARWTY